MADFYGHYSSRDLHVLLGLSHDIVMVLILTINKLPLINAMHDWWEPTWTTWLYTGELHRSKLNGPFHAVRHTAPMHIEAWPGVRICWCQLGLTMDRLITKMVRWGNWQGLQAWVSLWLLWWILSKGPIRYVMV